MTLKFTVSEEDQGKRLDVFLSEKLEISRAKAQQLIEDGQALVSGKVRQKSYKLQKDENVEVDDSSLRENKSPEVIIPQNIPLEILYRDEHIVAVSKPPGMVVYPSLGHPDHTVINALAYHVKKLASVGGPLRPGVVHRLDKDTSGVLLIAIDDRAYYGLVDSFKNRQVVKEYVAVVSGVPKPQGRLSLPIGRSQSDRKRMTTKTKTGKEAITEWTVERVFGDYSLIRVRIITGRTHQIRVHMSALGCPVIGDRVYGRKTAIEIGRRRLTVPRQMLHALSLQFKHPILGKIMKVEAPLPSDMQEIIEILEQAYGTK